MFTLFALMQTPTICLREGGKVRIHYIKALCTREWVAGFTSLSWLASWLGGRRHLRLPLNHTQVTAAAGNCSHDTIRPLPH